MNTVTVLLSAFNGEKYLTEQIDSLLRQKGIQLSILARDDGSSDRTISILQHYAETDKRFTYYCGKNIGPAKSFLELIAKTGRSDFYAFCDQDDVWDENKLVCAIERLRACDHTKPAYYYSNLRIVDQDLNFYRLSHNLPLIQESKYSALTEDMATGCTVVFNEAVARLVRERMPAYCSMHDSWIYLISKFFGTVVYDFDAHISYRQHGNNVVGTYLGKKTASIYIARIKRLFDRKLQPRYSNANSFIRCFGDMLEEDDLKKVEKLAYYKDNFGNRMKLLFDKDISASSLSREIRYRGLIILGIV